MTEWLYQVAGVKKVRSDAKNVADLEREGWQRVGADPRYTGVWMRKIVRPEESLECCPFCETPHQYSAEDLDGCRWGTTFYWTYWAAPQVSPVYGVAWETVACATCGGILYDGEMRD